MQNNIKTSIPGTDADLLSGNDGQSATHLLLDEMTSVSEIFESDSDRNGDNGSADLQCKGIWKRNLK